MCRYCERRQDLKFGWDQPPLFDEQWPSTPGRLKECITSNLNINGNSDWVTKIYDYKSTTPELLVESKEIADALWKGGIATLHIPIMYCPVCGRRLGSQDAKQSNHTSVTADAVPVVHCKDCNFYEIAEYDAGTKQVCRLLKRQMQEDDYCSNSMQKEALRSE